jgi:hypothetical protein
MKLPKINDMITTEQALELCKHFNLDYLIKRIESNSDKYKPWKFDGCSGLPDEVMGFFTRLRQDAPCGSTGSFTNCEWKDITYKCCLPHDLCYGYGEPGNKTERKRIDNKFYRDLVTKAHMREWCASAFLAAVQIGGAEVFGLSFSWGFAHK